MANKLVTIEKDNGINGLYHQCQGVSHYEPLPYGTHGNGSPVRCAHDSEYLVTLSGELTGREFTLHLCPRCAAPYIPQEGVH